MTEEAYGWSLDEITISELLWCAAYMDRIRMPPRQQASDQRSLSSSGSSDSDEDSDRIEDTGETSLPAPPTINEPRQPIYSAQPGSRSNQSNIEQRETSAEERASPVKVPDRFPLPQPAEISKSLLPFARRVSGALATELDIEATVERTAEANGLPMPVFRPPLQRWFDICLLVDQSPSMEFWGDLADGVATLFRWQGIFRDVRVWRFETNVEGSPRLLSGIDAMERRIESLITPGRARLFVVLTDTLGKAWRSGSAFEALAVLGAKHPVALAHVFPQPLWRRTALGRASERPLAAPFPGCANDQLTVVARLRETGAVYRFPVFNLSQQHLLTWAKHVAVEGGASIQGVLIRQKSLPSQPPTPEDEGDPPAVEDSPDTLVSACLQDLTPAARQLAGILAAVPLIPSVMRLAQQQFLPDTRHWHLAEVFFSGLIQRSTLGPTDAGVADAWYEFREGVREVLLRHSPVRTTTEVWREIGNFIEQNADSLRDFPALVPNEDGSIAEAELDRKRYFAEVKGSVLTTWGGEFAQKGRELLAEVRAYKSDKVSQLQGDSSEDVDWTALPECEDFEYESAQIVFLPSAPTPIPITVATISIEGLPTDVPDALSSLEFVGVKRLETVRFVLEGGQEEESDDDTETQQPMLPTTNSPVLRPEHFYGREAVRATIRNCIETRTSLNIAGVRKIGKTSLLNYVANRIEEFCPRESNPLAVQLDFQNPAFQFPSGITEGLRRSIKHQVGESPWDAVDNDDYHAVQRGLAQLQAQGRQLIVLLDAFESLTDQLEAFEGLGQDWQAKARAGLMTMVVVSRYPLSEMYASLEQGSPTEPFSNIFRTAILGPLEPQVWRQLVLDLMGGEVSDSLLEWVDRLTGGWPFLVQMAISMALQNEDLSQAEVAFQGWAANTFSSVWDSLNPDEHRVLETLVSSQEVRPRLLSQLQSSSLDASVIQRLQRFGLIREDGHCFSSAFELWLRERSGGLSSDGGDSNDASEFNQLESFPIRIATVERQASGWEVRYEASTAQRYVETLPGDVALELVAIPAGEFRMGSPLDEPERSGYEGPQHTVTIAYGFFMGRYPITQAQWRTVASLPQVNRELDPDPSRFEGDQRPVERVNWGDAVEFCNRLNHYFNGGLSNPRDYEYRLPSEAEWEYACRANTSTRFHFGDMITTDVANYNGASYAGGPSGESRGETTAVTMSDHANAFGLSDMHGNVREWCLDHWHDNYEDAPTDGSAWISSDESKNRVFRGGSWNYDPRYCRSAYRLLLFPENQDFGLGFRVVLAPR